MSAFSSEEHGVLAAPATPMIIGAATLHLGDCVEVMRGMPDASVDAVVTDPPYGIRFMGASWDGADIEARAARRRSFASHAPDAGPNGGHKSIAAEAGKYDLAPAAMRAFQEFSEEWAREAIRVLKPGGHLLSFASARTYHRMVCGLEDAGFEIRDQIFWVFSSGFPKSMNLDRLRGKGICGCEQGAESSAKCDVRFVRHADVQKAESAREGSRPILQHGLPEQGISAAGWTKLPSAEIRGRQPGLEGRGYDVQEEGQLQEHPLPASAGLAQADGAQGWLPDGASLGDGAVVRVPADKSGSGAPRRPRSGAEHTPEPGAVADEQQPQAMGAWPVCGRCALPMVPEGLGTGLKPAHEPICVARKPLVGTVAANVLQFGTGALNIDGCRVEPTGEGRERIGEASQDQRYASAGGTNFAAKPGPRGGAPEGRWPANLIHDGSAEVVAMFPAQAGASAPVRGTEASAASVGMITGERERVAGAFHGDTGSAARFFYCAKASRADRNAGLVDPGLQLKHGTTLRKIEDAPKASNIHPTVKPTDLMAYLCRLVTPPGGVVLDPFMGSGSTGKACAREGFDFIGIELEPEYMAISRARIEHEQSVVASAAVAPPTPQLDLFNEIEKAS